MIRIQYRAAMLSAMALVALTAISLTARAADPVQLQSIDVQTLSGQQVQLKLHMSGPAPEPLPFTIDKPARIAFDLPNTTLALASRRFDVRSGGVDTVLAAEANGRARLVVNVDNLMPYTTKVDGNDIIVTLGTAAGRRRRQARRRARCSRRTHRIPPSARFAPSISGAVPTAPAGSSCSSPTPVRRSMSGRKASRSSWTSRAPRCRRI